MDEFLKIPEAVERLQVESAHFDSDKLLLAAFRGSIVVGVLVDGRQYFLECGEIEKFIGQTGENYVINWVFENSEEARKVNLELTAPIPKHALELTELELLTSFGHNATRICYQASVNDLIVLKSELDSLLLNASQQKKVVFIPKRNEVAKFMCEVANDFINKEGREPSPRELKSLMLKQSTEFREAKLSDENSGDMLICDKKVTDAKFRERYHTYRNEVFS